MCVWKGRSTAADAAYDMPGKTEQQLALRAFTGEEDPAHCANQSHAFFNSKEHFVLLISSTPSGILYGFSSCHYQEINCFYVGNASFS